MLFLLGVFLVVRAAVEVVILDPSAPETFRHDWGGPHYLGVLAVHAGPGLGVLLLAARHLRRRARRTVPGAGAAITPVDGR